MVLFLTSVVSSPAGPHLLTQACSLETGWEARSPTSSHCRRPQYACCALSGFWCSRHQHALCFVCFFWGGVGILTRSKNYTKYLNTQKFCLIKCILLLKLLSCCLDTALSSFSHPSSVRTFPYHMQWCVWGWDLTHSKPLHPILGPL